MVLTLPFKRAVDIVPKLINFPANLRPSQIGVMIVDQSSFFCRPSLSRPANDNTSRVARHNAGLIERFREAGTKIVIVSWTPYRNYKSLNPYGDAKSLERYDVDHYGFERKDGDIHVIKTHNSGFNGVRMTNSDYALAHLRSLSDVSFSDHVSMRREAFIVGERQDAGFEGSEPLLINA